MPHVIITCTSGAVTEFDVNLTEINMTRAELVDLYAAAVAQEKSVKYGNYRFKQELGENHDKVFSVVNIESVEITGE